MWPLRTGWQHQRELRDLPVTQGSLMRLLIREGQQAASAHAVLSGTAADARHEFWPDDAGYGDVPTQGTLTLPSSPGPEVPGSPRLTMRSPSFTVMWSTWSPDS
jgi:hypothetical protein